ncbi:hypothetical protein EWM64_g698 [Hericium alpestre]|uniref:EIF3F/CSN6-like C-terminal domain-containing protein n=1 Tax=Hericium alpestre TaxID=135208 RepID=A0A4Z0AAP2_9AGAM|nr:hypothetical protein EWM64_g698 [Hericium alpestre]
MFRVCRYHCRHPLPILNISEHLTRLRLQTKSSLPFVLGALLGTQNGREVDIVNSFELTVTEDEQVDHDFLNSRKDQYKQVFPSLEFIGWYTVASAPTARHIALHEQYVKDVVAGAAQKDHATLRSLSALIASLPASENKHFRGEFDTEYEDVQLTAYLSTLTKSASILNDLVDKHVVMSSSNREERAPSMASRRRGTQPRGLPGFSGHGGWD